MRIPHDLAHEAASVQPVCYMGTHGNVLGRGFNAVSSTDILAAEMASSAQRSVPSDHQIDSMHSHTISRLLAEPTPEAMQVYYSRLTKLDKGLGLEVKYIGSDMGKGVFASQNFEEDELVLKEHMLVGAQHTHNKPDALVCSFCFCFIGSIELQIGRRLLIKEERRKEFSQDSCAHVDESSERNASAKNLPLGLIESLLNENLRLPFTDHFPMPPVVSCFGGCTDEFFCSEKCAKASWESFHSLLCTGPKSLCKDKEMLCEFKHHADETNDIFHVAAKVISSTILGASKLKRKEPTSGVERYLGPHNENEATTSLLKAWEPFSMGHKRLWWDSLALPADLGPGDEFEFRKQIRELSAISLNLLKGALFQEEYAPLFSLQVYGHIIGMFELNNLDLVVASPVEDYFIFLDELPQSEKIQAEKVTRPLLHCLNDEYDIPCQGTAFFPFQSCINHSCCPNVKAFKRDEDKDGQAVLLAVRPIKKGEQVTISYIDENSSWEERKTMLEDYGFICNCCKCIEEST